MFSIRYFFLAYFNKISKDLNPYNGNPKEYFSPMATETPIRKLVNDPGPIHTAINLILFELLKLNNEYNEIIKDNNKFLDNFDIHFENFKS